MAGADEAAEAVYAGIVDLIAATSKQSGVVRGQMVRDAAIAYWAISGDHGSGVVQVQV
ncbi:MAG: hypothetical protein ACYDDU_22430 [Dermatophilaceae bacterium]